MNYSLYRNGHRFCIGLTYIVEDYPGQAAVYWNPKKKSFQDNATECWSELYLEDEILADFARRVIFKENKK